MEAKELRNSILQMAVQGKLVPQDTDDEPASELLERIRAERARLIREKKIRAPRGGESLIYRGEDGSFYERRGTGEPVCIDDEIPFEIPPNWGWARLESCCKQVIDCPHSTPQYISVDTGYYAIDTNCFDSLWNLRSYRYLSYDTYKNRIKKYAPTIGDLVFSREGSIGRSVILDRENVCLGQRVMVLSFFNMLLINRYCQIVLSSPYAWTLYSNANVGTGVKHINVSMIKNMIVPVPPYNEQLRILKKLDNLIPLNDDYEKLEYRLNIIENALPSQLKKSILQMAIQGRLVPKDPDDEPAFALLERIRAERARLVREKKIRAPRGGESFIYRGEDGSYYERRGEGEPVCIDNEIPFDIPESWEWARLESVTCYIQRGKSPVYSAIKKYPVVAQKCNQWSGFSLERAKFIDPETVGSYQSERILRDGDLLLNSTGLGTVGRMAVYDSSKNPFGWAVADSHVSVIRPNDDWVLGRFLYSYFSNPTVQNVIEDQTNGSTKQRELLIGTVRNYLTPIPPHDEQVRIVNRIDSLQSILNDQTF